MEQHLIYGSGVLSNSVIQRRIDIVNSNKIILNNTDSLSSQLVNTGCEYIVIYNFDLNNTSITIPNNCILNFQGGSILNGTITLQNTKLEGDVRWNNVTISGSCTNDLLTPQMFGAYPALIETENNKTRDTLGFQNLARVVNNQGTAGKNIYLSSGHYAIAAVILFEVSCSFYGDGETTVIDCYDGSGRIQFGALYSSQPTLYPTLDITITTDAHKSDRKIVVDDATELNEGDYLIICDSKNGSFYRDYNWCKTCECIKIKKIVGNNVYIDDILYGDYFADFGEDYSTSFSPTPTNRTLLTRFIPNVYNISNLKILSHEHQNGSPGSYYSFLIYGFRDSKISNIIVDNHGNNITGYIGLGLNYEIDKCVFRNYTIYNECAGIMVASCQNFTIKNSLFRANSNSLTQGTSQDPISIQCRNFIYDNLKFETSEKINYNLENEYNFIDLSTNADSQYGKLINITAPQTSVSVRGYNTTIEGCKFYHIFINDALGHCTIRNCELFASGTTQMLFVKNNRENETSGNSISIENNIFHGRCSVLLQDNYFTVPYDSLIVKNNTFDDNFYFGQGYVKSIVVENNFSNYGYIGSNAGELKVKALSFKNNVINDGYVYLGFTDYIAEGIISNNTIMERTERTRDLYYLLGINSFKGSIQGNIIISYVDNYYTSSGSTINHVEVIGIDKNSDVRVYDNVLRKGVGNCRHGLIEVLRNSKAICDRNTQNSIRTSYINNNQYSNNSSFSTYYGKIQSLDRIECNSDTLGRLVYDNYSNTMYYTGHRRDSEFVTRIYTNYQENGQKVSQANPLVYGKSYILNINNSGSDRYALYFSKYSMEDENFNEDELVCAVGEAYVGSDYVFSAEDPAIYPYLYATSTSSGVHVFLIYENMRLSCYDGAAYGTPRRGTTANRPSYRKIYEGFKYYDTDLNKELIASEFVNNKVYWREYDGAIAGVKRIGTTSERPTGTYNESSGSSYARANIYVGFKYIDTTIGKEIYASAIDGNTVTWTEVNTPQINEQITYN